MHSGSSLPKTYLLVICILAFSVNVMGFGCPPKGKPELKDFQFGCCSKGNREFASFPGVPNFDAEFGCADRTINTAFCCKFITKQSKPNQNKVIVDGPNPPCVGNIPKEPNPNGLRISRKDGKPPRRA
ncbi:hypothetical protein PTTG_12486 [Puccinia triticina 1-1 BBBD Race 1]|uniref:Hydrophobin n=2 Tax=Puccinia triticina TaxID=208348 RepID=A0A180GN94_PUCT1|nr:uncharacterized protein PtA15_14A359 [Puccinia triticina]OAV94276.1 hypothetical protein PTTG_12486 [Puccinia triticina 1-1 BBBD Race 1]WAQ91475.1 hypothetical protein PtA15_14A359 [Puccinia triticina]